MRFYALDPALEGAIRDGNAQARVRVELGSGDGTWSEVAEGDLLAATFTSAHEKEGGTASRGELVLDNAEGAYTAEGDGKGSGRAVLVSFSVGYGQPFVPRFSFYADGAGFRELKGPGTRRRVLVGLEDLSGLLRRTDAARDWTDRASFAFVRVCDKTDPSSSLVHLAALRAGLGTADIDCSTIGLGLDWVSLGRDLWAELSDLARTYRCHLECAVEKPLVFAHSPYQDEAENGAESSWRFDGGNVYCLRSCALRDGYRNTVRLKLNLPRVLARQELWRYEDPPVGWDGALRPTYAFRAAAVRAVSEAGYVARYRVREAGGVLREVVYADQVDLEAEASARLDYTGGPLAYTAYDTASRRDGAVVRLEAVGDADLHGASIHGRPIVLDLNTCCFARDEEEIALEGTCALNVTGSLFSYSPWGGRPMYEDWAERELEERRRPRRAFLVRTNRAVFHARVGALVTVADGGEEAGALIRALRFSYRRDGAFSASFDLEEA